MQDELCSLAIFGSAQKKKKKKEWETNTFSEIILSSAAQPYVFIAYSICKQYYTVYIDS